MRGYAQQDPLVAYKKESFDLFEAMMLRFQEDTARFLFRMQIVGPDGQPYTEAPELDRTVPAAPPVESAEIAPPNAPTLPPPPPKREIPARIPTTTIDAIEKEFERKKQRELEAARMASSSSGSREPVQRNAGSKVGRNDPCPCGSGKKFKKCHGVEA
jgi:preprotein translocase subunit SecA